MRKLLLRLLFITFPCLFSLKMHAHVELLAPLGGESFFASTIETIVWDDVIPHDTQNWDLYISYNGGDAWTPLFLNIPPDQFSFAWNVPYIASEQVRIRVVQDNNIDIDYDDESDNFTIIVPPQDGPVIELPAMDLTLSCNEPDLESIIDEWLQENGGAMASGTCGDLHWSHNYTGRSDSCGLTGTALVTFQVSDDCGGNLTSARVTVVDQTAPDLLLPAQSQIQECDGQGSDVELTQWINMHGGASAADDCSEITWIQTILDYEELCNSGIFAEMLFIASDACGNTAASIASFTKQDTEPPMITIPPVDLELVCDGTDHLPAVQIWVSLHGHAQAIDSCGEVMWTYQLQQEGTPCGMADAYWVYFIASDDCGNASSDQALIDIRDMTPPVWVDMPRDTVIHCSGDPSPAMYAWLNDFAGAHALDDCSEVTFGHDFAGSPACVEQSGTVTFTATDACGNESLASSTYTILPITSVHNLAQPVVRIAPNPAKEEFTIEIENFTGEEVEVVMYNTLGKVEKRWRHTENDVTLRTKDIGSGLYYVVVSGRTFTYAAAVVLE